MNKQPPDTNTSGNNCQAYIKQFVSWHLNCRDMDTREIISDDIMTILKTRPNEHYHKFSLYKQAFTSFHGQFLKSDPFDERNCYLDTTTHTREEFISMCVDEGIKQALLEQDNKNIKWYGEREHFKPLVFLFCGARYWDLTYEGTFEIFSSPPKLSIVR